MKKYFTLVAFLVISTFSYGQFVNYGIRAGINNSNLNFDPEPDSDVKARNGFAFGGFVEYGFSNETSSVMVELQWSAEGAKDRAFRANYLNLPIQYRFIFRDFSVGIGPQASLKIWENNDVFSTLNFSGVIGATYMITEELFIDARYALGLTNVLDEDITGDIEAKNNTIQIGFGIKL